MAKNKQPSQKQIDRLYREYERQAAFTLKQKFDDWEKKARSVNIIFFDLIYFILTIVRYDNIPMLFFAELVVMTLMACAAAKITRCFAERKIQNSKAARIERTEGYTRNLLDALYAMPENPQHTIASVTAWTYTFLGNAEMALMELKKVNPDDFRQNPNGAHEYYSALLMAYLLAGNLDCAADTYSKGFYYMNTYKASPISGSYVSVALGMYEYFCGHYETSLQLLDIGMRAGYADVRLENRIPDENMTSVICYWKAINLASMGNKAAAWESINYCKNFHKTDYYRQCCERLLIDMEKNHKSEMSENAETFS